MTKTFGEFIKTYRIQKGLSQEELGSIFGVERSTISKWESESSYPTSSDAEKIAANMEKVSAVEIHEAIAVSQRQRNSNANTSFMGNYELFQWSYLYDQHIMKTNITIQQIGKKNKLEFEEQITTDQQIAIVRGTVSIVLPNMFLYGRSDDRFKECELIIVPLPRKQDAWLYGVVAGISADRGFPSSSRAVLHYLGNKKFNGSPKYAPLRSIKLLPQHKEYLSEPPDASCPILSARPRNLR